MKQEAAQELLRIERHPSLLIPVGIILPAKGNPVPVEGYLELLLLRSGGRQEGWLFPSPRAAAGHLTTVSKQFREARRKAALPESLVLYCARHTFGTAAYEATGNLAMVMKVMGHTGARTVMQYQHPRLDPIRDAIDERNSRHNSRHSEEMVR